ncbi:DUF2922 domain-containing protein [Lacticaseibacillus nasuensis]|jgi:hypothetical protein|uniref:DUF2922 domain-containing protein n=1 Tax=Lacticaseibacillus nasuensis TaxID=944671 RepID=UPI0022457137|nr:DUF2922 domain-containing protein [Lacticaseibacillus nasuensis]MCX2456515.1 DUF2922 domain-containing protein [Lacticaseibacillus nasuensis]
MADLQMTFLTADKGKKSIRVPNIDALDPELVKAVMADIAAANIVEAKGVRQFTEPLSAKLVETKNTVLFDLTQAS